jgi:putative addiction module component (TIGR02574 family)
VAHPKQIVEELLKLPREDREAAAEALLASLEEDGDDEGAGQAWADEIERRVSENAPGSPADQVFAEGRERLKSDR